MFPVCFVTHESACAKEKSHLGAEVEKSSSPFKAKTQENKRTQ